MLASRLSTQISVFPALKQGKAERITNGFRLYRLWNADQRPFVTEVRVFRLKCALSDVLTASIPAFGCLHTHGDWIRHLGQSHVPHAQLRTIFNLTMSTYGVRLGVPRDVDPKSSLDNAGVAFRSFMKIGSQGVETARVHATSDLSVRYPCESTCLHFSPGFILVLSFSLRGLSRRLDSWVARIGS